MSTTTQHKSIAELARGPDGDYHCPGCADEAFESMDELVGHISDEHNPYREWFVRWGGMDA